MSTANSSTTSATSPAAKTTAAKPAEGGTSTTRALPPSSAEGSAASQGASHGSGSSGQAVGATEHPKVQSQPQRQVDMPIQGERQCYFGEVVNERGTFWAQFLVRVVDKVTILVDSPEPAVLATHLLGGNAKLFVNRQITHTETHRSASGEDQIFLYIKGGTGYADRLVFQYNRV